MSDNEKAPLGDYLRNIRVSRQLTLRDVENSGIGISNAYLSQLEQGKIAKPSPNFLHKLAEFYGLQYNLLMEKAGYISAAKPSSERTAKKSGRLAPSALGELSREEEEQLLVYLTVLRTMKKG